MKKITDIRQRREDRFWNNRMKLSAVQKVEDMNREVEVHSDLISNKELKERIQENLRERLREKEEQNKEKRGKIVMEQE